jgi:hypothetical protein
MSFPLWDMAKDLAVARALDGAPDPEKTMKRRLAALVGVPTLAAAAAAGAATHSWIVGVAVAIVLIGSLWLFAEGRPRWLGGHTP